MDDVRKHAPAGARDSCDVRAGGVDHSVIGGGFSVAVAVAVAVGLTVSSGCPLGSGCLHGTAPYSAVTDGHPPAGIQRSPFFLG